MPRDDPIAAEAWRREASHQGHPKNRPHLRPIGANLMGLRGEEAFAERYGLAVDLTPRLGGDGGHDLKVTVWQSYSIGVYPVDCKAALIPKDLIVEAARIQPDTIYVLCKYSEADDRCELLGWQWGRVLMRSPPKDYGYGVMNHWQPRSAIRTMGELDERVLLPDDDWEWF
jgi:hypothetical protein